jgi:hypothetical protein
MPFYLTDDDYTDRPDGPECLWCNDPIAALTDYEPYCSEPCAIQAALDSLEDE